MKIETQKTEAPANIDAYIAQFPEDIQKLLGKIRQTIHEVAPEAAEKISYGMPGFFLNGPLVYFAAYPRHIGFYPTGEGIEAFKGELVAYQWSKGAVQFPLDQPIPYELIKKMVKHRVDVNLARAGVRKSNQ